MILAAAAFALVVFWLVSLTPNPQYALLSAAGAFIVASVIPVAQAWLAVSQAELTVRQTELVELMNERDARRFAQEQAEANKRAELVIAIENGNEEAFWPGRWWSRGIITEALQAVIHYARETLGLSVLRAWCDAENIGSARVLEKAGFTLERTGPAAIAHSGFGDKIRPALFYVCLNSH